MAGVIAQTLPYALGVNLGAVTIIVAILMLMTRRPKGNGFAFLAGFMLGLAVLGALALAVTGTAAGVGRAGTTQSDGLIRLALGVLLLGMAFLAWKRRPRAGETLPMPKWIAGIDNFAPWKSFSFALVTSILNPKNLVLIMAAAVIMKETPSRAGDNATEMIIFILLSSLSVAVPVLFYAVAPDRAGPTLNRWRLWLISNSVIITVLVLLLFGVELVAKGLAGLLG